MRAAESDLTAKARIRDAALEVFAERGEKGATIRTIAARAAVSPALVQHHFGTKAGLRAVCDAYALDYLRTEAAAGLEDGRVADPTFTAEVLRSGPSVTRYLVRALVDDSPGSEALFDEMVAISEPYLRAQDPELPVRAKAAVLVAMKLGVTAFAPQLSRTFGVPLYSPAGMALSGRAQLELLNPDLTDPAVFEQARQGLAGLDPDDAEPVPSQPAAGAASQPDQPAAATAPTPDPSPHPSIRSDDV